MKNIILKYIGNKSYRCIFYCDNGSVFIYSLFSESETFIIFPKKIPWI